MYRPVVGHQDFRGLLDRGDVPNHTAVQDLHGRGKSSAAGDCHA
jgi:hypothetical protein